MNREIVMHAWLQWHMRTTIGFAQNVAHCSIGATEL
jgi:hypothetical protein